MGAERRVTAPVRWYRLASREPISSVIQKCILASPHLAADPSPHRRLTSTAEESRIASVARCSWVMAPAARMVLTGPPRGARARYREMWQ
jgi:hypothetical protein